MSHSRSPSKSPPPRGSPPPIISSAPPIYASAQKRVPELIESALTDAERKSVVRIRLRNALQSGDGDACLHLLNTTPDVAEEPDAKGTLPLHIALDQPPSALIDDVICRLCEIYGDAARESSPIANGDLPLHVALLAGGHKVEVISDLLSCYTHAAAESANDGRLPLVIALENGEPCAIIEELVSDPKKHAVDAVVDEASLRMPLHLALEKRASDDVILLLLERHERAVKWADCNGYLPLHTAAATDASLRVVKALVAARPQAAMDGCRAHQQLPLHVAVSRGASEEMVKYLLTDEAHGPETRRARDQSGCMPLHCALIAGAEPEIVLMLLRAYPQAAMEWGSMARPEGQRPPPSPPSSPEEGDGRSRGRRSHRNKAHEHARRNHEAAEEKKRLEIRRLPLHLALAHNASAEVFEALFEANREAAWQADGDGKHALAVAFESGVPQDVCYRLILANPKAAQGKDAHGQVAASAGVLPPGTSRVESMEWLRLRPAFETI